MNELKENAGKFMLMCNLLAAFFFVFFLLLKKSFLFFNIIPFLAALFLFIVAKELDKEKGETFFWQLYFSVILFLINTANAIFFTRVSKFSGGSVVLLSILSAFITFGIFTAFARSDSFKTFKENFIKLNILSKLNIQLLKEELENGDVTLCINKESQEKVILKGKDRFLHMLILGPTGSGKTSQTIIPMINQDLQNKEAGMMVLEPKGDLAEKVICLANNYGREAFYFNPILDGCPRFNPLYGKEEDVIENITTSFKMLNPDSPQFFKDMNEVLLRNAVKIIKRLYGNSEEASMVNLATLISNPNGQGKLMVLNFQQISAPNKAMLKENSDISAYFLNDYFAEKSKTYEHCSGVRTQIAKLVSNKFLRKVIGEGKNDIDFDKILKEGRIVSMTTAQGKLRELGRFLGFFLILNFQSSVFKRPGNEDTRRYFFLYIDEFQVYANPGFADMLTQGRSYRVASHLATQNRALIGMGSGRDGEDFLELVSTNARNLVLYPGMNAKDAKIYSEEFGEVVEKKVQKGFSRASMNPLYGIPKSASPNISERYSEELVPRFSIDDLILRPFGEIVYRIIKNNSVQIPSVGQISYIDINLNKAVNKMVEENHALMMFGINPNKARNLENHGELKENVKNKIGELIAKAKGISDGNLSMEATVKELREDETFLDIADNYKNNPSIKEEAVENITTKSIVGQEEKPVIKF